MPLWSQSSFTRTCRLARSRSPAQFAANMSAMLLYIITNAVLFSFLMSHENIPQLMANWITSTGLSSFQFLLLVNLLLLVAGNVMEPSSIVLIIAPILFPVAVKLGVDPVHFGVLITLNMEIGMCHPPVGLNLYVASGIARMGITELTVAVMPWLMALLALPHCRHVLAGLIAVAPKNARHDVSHDSSGEPIATRFR